MSFQALKTWKESNEPDFEVKKNRILEPLAFFDEAPGRGGRWLRLYLARERACSLSRPTGTNVPIGSVEEK